MASRAPLVLAAALFVLGIAGLAQTVRQTGSGATPAPLTDLAMQPLVLPTASQSVASATLAEAVSDATVPPPAPTAAAAQPSAAPLAPVVPEAAATATATATAEPTPDSHGGAIAAGVASDGNETTPASATTRPLHPLRLGMIAADESGGAATATPTASPTVSPTVSPTATPVPPAATP